MKVGDYLFIKSKIKEIMEIDRRIIMIVGDQITYELLPKTAKNRDQSGRTYTIGIESIKKDYDIYSREENPEYFL